MNKLNIYFTLLEIFPKNISDVKPTLLKIFWKKALDPFKKAVDDDIEKQLLRNHLKKIVKISGGVPKIHVNFHFQEHLD